MYTVTVAFRADREFEFHVHADDVAGLDQSSAREWLHEEFDELECTPTNPVGKVLVLDVILNVAKYGGESRFEQAGEWAKKFAVVTAAALDRPALRVDVSSFVVG